MDLTGKVKAQEEKEKKKDFDLWDISVVVISTVLFVLTMIAVYRVRSHLHLLNLKKYQPET